eukprot:10291513-Lingulodinium_polyedra.AAC.1
MDIYLGRARKMVLVGRANCDMVDHVTQDAHVCQPTNSYFYLFLPIMTLQPFEHCPLRTFPRILVKQPPAEKV